MNEPSQTAQPPQRMTLAMLQEECQTGKCGACCRHVGTPPSYYPAFALRPEKLNDDDRATDDYRYWQAMPQELRDDLTAYYRAVFIEKTLPDRTADGEMPCLWYDEDKRSCRHHEYRPQVCREFEAGEVHCLAHRRQTGVQTGRFTELEAFVWLRNRDGERAVMETVFADYLERLRPVPKQSEDIKVRIAEDAESTTVVISGDGRLDEEQRLAAIRKAESRHYDRVRAARMRGGRRMTMNERPPDDWEHTINVPGGTVRTRSRNTIVNATADVGRNAQCPCGSGKKFKRCCGGK